MCGCVELRGWKLNMKAAQYFESCAGQLINLKKNSLSCAQLQYLRFCEDFVLTPFPIGSIVMAFNTKILSFYIIRGWFILVVIPWLCKLFGCAIFGGVVVDAELLVFIFRGHSQQSHIRWLLLYCSIDFSFTRSLFYMETKELKEILKHSIGGCIV